MRRTAGVRRGSEDATLSYDALPHLFQHQSGLHFPVKRAAGSPIDFLDTVGEIGYHLRGVPAQIRRDAYRDTRQTTEYEYQWLGPKGCSRAAEDRNLTSI